MKPERIQSRLTESLPHWERHPRHEAITRTYLFPGARPAMAFAQYVAEVGLAQKHPEILIRRSEVTLTLPLGDDPLSDADFELARLIDRRRSG